MANNVVNVNGPSRLQFFEHAVNYLIVVLLRLCHGRKDVLIFFISILRPVYNRGVSYYGGVLGV